MKLISNRTIKFKIIFIILGVTIMSIGLSSVYEIINTIHFLKKEVTESQQINAKLIAENCVTTLVFNDASGATRVLQSLKTIPDITSALIYDMEEVVFANYIGNDQNVIDGKLQQHNNFKADKNHIIINEPIEFDGIQYGTLSLVISTKTLQDKIYKYLLWLGITLIVVIILAVIMASMFQRIISQPILKLANFAEIISDSKNYELRIEKTTNDETGILYDRFNSMLHKIEEHQTQRDYAEKELTLERENLEKRVQKRTIELEKSKKKAEESDRLKSAFLANLSHEIRTPMNGIIGFADLLNEPDISEQERIEFIQVINSSGRQLLSIINDIIEISKIETNQIKISEEVVDLNNISSELRNELKISKYRNKNVDFKWIKSNELIEKIISDKTKLKQILTNLITNAFKNTKSGFVDFGYKIADNSFVEFFVTDTGSGIDKKDHEIIFERFRQVELEKKRIQSGSGLGLAISKAYVELMGGTIQLETEPGKGSTFSFRIPLQEISTEPNINTNYKSPDMDFLKNDVILIAEDDDINFKLLQILFSGIAGKIIWAQNGKEAVEICKSNPEVSLVLMDVKMPIMGGLDATRIIKESRPRLPIIAATAHALYNDKEMILEAGCDAYISKPILKEKLFHLIKEVKNKHN